MQLAPELRISAVDRPEENLVVKKKAKCKNVHLFLFEKEKTEEKRNGWFSNGSQILEAQQYERRKKKKVQSNF